MAKNYRAQPDHPVNIESRQLQLGAQWCFYMTTDSAKERARILHQLLRESLFIYASELAERYSLSYEPILNILMAQIPAHDGNISALLEAADELVRARMTADSIV